VGLETANAKAMIARTQRNHRFYWGYGVAFFICWVTQAIFFGIAGRRASLLAFALLRLEESIRVPANRMIGRQIIPYFPPAYAFSVIIAALLAALPFAAAFIIAGAQGRALRWTGYLALALLAFMTLYWPLISTNIF
jgi:hypothetical protein